MTQRQIAAVAVVLLVVLGVTALVAYRWGRRHGISETRLAGAAEARPATSSHGCVDFHDAVAHIGETSCVTGRVLRVFTSKSGNSFLDFCADYRDCPFTSVIFESDHSKFGNLSTLTGRQVEIHGTIVQYQGHAEIVVSDPDQIREAQ
jgi:hypothetical protein